MNLRRVIKAMAREGLDLSKDGPIYRVKRHGSELDAEVLLPEGFPLEMKAFVQLARFAAVQHPDGGRVCRACATPDFHPGSEVPVGAVVATSNMVIPQAIGSDINCGMRLHVADLTIDKFQASKDKLIELLKGDLLLGTRDLPATVETMRGMFALGIPGWLDGEQLGAMAKADRQQLEDEQARVYGSGMLGGHEQWAPEGLLPEDREVIRDGGLGTVGGGNHFVEIQVVDEISNHYLARKWGVRVGQIAFMVHTGSRSVGKSIGTRWSEIARERWPKNLKWPEIFSLVGEDAEQYIEAMNTAANYAFVNRMLIAELVRLRLREVYGDLEVPLVYDLPHNIIFYEDGLYVHRKGATPSHPGQPVIIPGSMGHPSYLMVGILMDRFLNSCSHGAGRSSTRFEMTRRGRPDMDLGLEGVECITLRAERLIEEAPAAYKDVGRVVDVQVEQRMIGHVARLQPVLTFKS